MILLDDRTMFFLVFLSIAFIFAMLNISLIGRKKLTNFQRNSRVNLAFMQASLLFGLTAFAFGLNFILNFIHSSFFVDVLGVREFKSRVFVALGFAFLIFNYWFNRKLALVDERVVKIKQDTPFHLAPLEKTVKKIKDYAHFFSGINFEFSPKDYTVQNLRINISEKEMEEFSKKQKQKFKSSLFFEKLVDYVNLKSDDFEYEKINNEDLENLSLEEMKNLILEKFEIFKVKQFFPSLSQLYQISNLDETEFLSFLRDFSNDKYTSMSLTHAIFYLKKGE